MLINIHSHSPAAVQEFALQNCHENFSRVTAPGFYSIGLHPWYIQAATWQHELDEIKIFLERDNVLALGECGLDRVCETDFELQKKVFAAQVTLANACNKPLIIHSVRSQEDVLRILKQIPAAVPVIFHGFNKKLSVAQSILQAGHWLSFGKAILHPGMKEVFEATALNKIFLETDDASISIECIYAAAASIKNIHMDELSLQIEQNFQLVFKMPL